MIKHILTTAACAICLTATSVAAESWTMDGDASIIGFGSIKNTENGEAHTISGVSGTVAEDGTVNVALDLTTVQTNIDIRNERIGEFVFDKQTNATLTASVDMEAVGSLGVGDYMVTEVEGDLSLLGNDIPVFLDMFIMQTAEGQVLVTSNSMLFVATQDAGIDAGIDMLQQLASLDSITRAFPVTMRFLFNADG